MRDEKQDVVKAPNALGEMTVARRMIMGEIDLLLVNMGLSELNTMKLFLLFGSSLTEVSSAEGHNVKLGGRIASTEVR